MMNSKMCQKLPLHYIIAFVAELRVIAENCNFGETLNTMLWDRVVCGMNNDSMQKRLLETKLAL